MANAGNRRDLNLTWLLNRPPKIFWMNVVSWEEDELDAVPGGVQQLSNDSMK